jgi:mannose-6-phosphate isomerase
VTSGDDPSLPELDSHATTTYQAPRQDKPWGHERIFAVAEGKYVGKILHINAGHCLSLQYHDAKEETIHVISGQALVHYGEVGGALAERTFGPGDTIHLPAKAIHRVTAVSDIELAEASTAYPGWREDVVRLEDRYNREGTSAP